MDFLLGIILGIVWSIFGFLTTLTYLVNLAKNNQQYLIESVLGGTWQVLLAQVAVGVVLGIVVWPLFWFIAFLGFVVAKVKGSAKD